MKTPKAKPCHYCKETTSEEERCGALTPEDEDIDYGCCTRKRGHKGIHVACGIREHRIVTWKTK